MLNPYPEAPALTFKLSPEYFWKVPSLSNSQDKLLYGVVQQWLDVNYCRRRLFHVAIILPSSN